MPHSVTQLTALPLGARHSSPAVPTPRCPSILLSTLTARLQPNSIEFDLAIEWRQALGQLAVAKQELCMEQVRPKCLSTSL